MTDTSTTLYTRPNLSARAGCSLLGTACDEPGTTAVCPSGLIRHEYTGENGTLFNLTLLQLPLSLHFPGAGPAAQPQLLGVMSTAFTHCVVLLVGNESWKRYFLRRLQKTGSVEAEVTSCGKMFRLICRQPEKRGRPWSPATLVEQSVRPTMMNAGADGWCRRRDVCH